jgi:hypothetical protein
MRAAWSGSIRAGEASNPIRDSGAVWHAPSAQENGRRAARSLINFYVARVSRSLSNEQEPDGSTRRARCRTFGSIFGRNGSLARSQTSNTSPPHGGALSGCRLHGRHPRLWVGSKCWSLHRSLKPRDVGSIPTQPTKSSRTRSGADACSTTKVSSETAMQVNVSRSTHWCATPESGVRLPSSAPCVDFTRSSPQGRAVRRVSVSHESELPSSTSLGTHRAVCGPIREATRERRM